MKVRVIFRLLLLFIFRTLVCTRGVVVVVVIFSFQLKLIIFSVLIKCLNINAIICLFYF